MRSSSGPYSLQRPDSCHSSAGWTTGITSSSAPARFISSRTMRSTLRSTRRPIGSQLYSPAARRRIRPARSISWWLTTSASAGVSLMVLMGYWDSLIAGFGSGGIKEGMLRILSRRPLLRLPWPRRPSCHGDGTRSTEPKPRRKGIYLLPNLLTTGCLFSGFYAIVAAIDKHFDAAGMAVFVAMIFDTLDGRIARLTRTESAFGKEYDSLADMVAFGARAGDRRLPVGRGAHRRVRPALGPFRLARLLLLRGRRGAAPGALQRPLRERRQALFRGAAEPVGGGDRGGVRVVLRATGTSRA